MREWIYSKALATLWITLAVYILIWCTVSYMGVYVTYVAGPLLLLSGLVAYSAKPREKADSKSVEWTQ
jgi:hypothetical protein